MAAPLVERSTGDIIPASDHNDVKDYIEDGTYRVNTLSLNIGGTEIIDSNRNIADAETGAHTIGTAGQSAILSANITATGVIRNNAVITFADGDTTPSVSGGNSFKTANTSPTTITNFDDGALTQRININILDTNTTIANNATIDLRNGNDYVGNVGDCLNLGWDGTKWVEHQRLVSKNHFYPTDGNTVFGTYSVDTIGSNSSGAVTFHAPEDVDSITAVYLYCIIDAAAAGSGKDIDFTTNYGTIGEAYNAHTGSDTTSTYDLTGLSNQIYAFNLTSLFSSMSKDDVGGILIQHNSIGGNIYYLGVEIVYKGYQ